jgi:hypothetical protein
MVRVIELQHYINKENYQNIILHLSTNNETYKTETRNTHTYKIPDSLIYEVFLFDGEYKNAGHIYILVTKINSDILKIEYEDFKNVLYKEYALLFGMDAMHEFPGYDELVCDYIEYDAMLPVENADQTLNHLRANGKFEPEQLEYLLWDSFKKSFGVIEFCLCKISNKEIRMFARCRGSALKKRIKDTSLHIEGGVIPKVVINEITEKNIFDWLCKQYKVYDALC